MSKKEYNQLIRSKNTHTEWIKTKYVKEEVKCDNITNKHKNI